MPARYEMYLEHHGINGMHWGKKNGPPYPLNYDDLSSEERAAAKEKAIRDGNVSEANANRKHYSDNEINSVINRHNLNLRLSQLDAAQVKSGLQKMSEIADKAQTVGNIVTKTSYMYNSIAKVANAFGNADLPIVGEKSDDKKSKKSSDSKQSNKKSSSQSSKSEKKEESLSEHIAKQNAKEAERQKRKDEYSTFVKYYNVR